MIAEFFDIEVPKDVTKQVPKDNLYKKLVDVGIILRVPCTALRFQSKAAVEIAAEDVKLSSDSVVPHDPRIF